MAKVENKASCGNCGGGCCADMIMDLNAAEARWMLNSGSLLVAEFEADPDVNWGKMAREYPDSQDLEEQDSITRARTLSEGMGTYFMFGACGNLVDNNGWLQCVRYEDPGRPRICTGLQEGSKECQVIFDARRDVVVELTKKPKIVAFPIRKLGVGRKIISNYEEKYGKAV